MAEVHIDSQNQGEKVLKTNVNLTNPYPERPPNPLIGASLFSRSLFSWTHDILQKGSSRVLEEIDIPEVAEEDSSAYNGSLFEKIWKNELIRVNNLNSKRKKKIAPKFHWAIVLFYLKKRWYVQIFYGLGMTADVIAGLVLGYLIQTFVDSKDEIVGPSNSYFSNLSSSGYFWATLLLIFGGVRLFCVHHSFFIGWRTGNQLKHGAISIIHAKSLRLPSIGGIEDDSASSGKVVNLATNDAERFLGAALFVSFLFWAPLQAIAVLVIGLDMFGAAFAAGYLLLAVAIPLQVYIGKHFAIQRSKIAKITDSRITLVSQAVSGVRVMKMSGWENQFNARIAAVREKEMKQIRVANWLRALNESIFFFTNIVTAIVIFVVHVANGGTLSPRNVFTSYMLINVVQMNMSKYFAFGVALMAECYVSVSRLQKFLEYPELSKSVLYKKESAEATSYSDEKSHTIVCMSNVVCHWNTITENTSDIHNKIESVEPNGDHLLDEVISNDNDSETNEFDKTQNTVALQNITINIHSGELYCIIGVVGSGKSALLQAIAGELQPSTGKITCRYKSLAYASQDSWIMNGSVKENVTMGLEYKDEWYKQVVSACGLDVDFKQFKNGDDTIVGDRGIQCSGGQRARIGLARALYRDTDILLLDDPLSAVDSRVGRLIFYSAIHDLCIKAGKCVILVTHQHQFIGNAKCILMHRGSMKCMGSYAECIERSGGILLKTIQTKDSAKESIEYITKNEVDVEISPEKAMPTKELSSGMKNTGDDDKDHEEMNTTGDVKWNTWKEYAKAMGGIHIGIMLLLLIVSAQVVVLVTIAIIGTWAEMSPSEQQNKSMMGLVLGLGAVVIFLAIIRALASFSLTLRASQRLHDIMSWQVLRAKIEFFDTNPLGRILNRFSADVGSNDDLLPGTFFDFLSCAVMVLGGVATSLSVLPITTLALPPLIIYFMRLRNKFLSTSRELKRIDGISRSPLYAMLSESLSGIATIRTNSAVQYFREKFDSLHDANINAFFMFIATSRWLGLRLDLIVHCLVVLCSFTAVLFNDRGWFNISPAILGLALTMLLQLASLFQWTVRQSAELVNQMISVERVSAFSHVASESSLCTSEDEKHQSWPKTGNIEVDNLCVRYRSNLPPSLSGVSFKIQNGQRVGIVGRTGCGKSTLVQALFRILEAEKGSIKVDGVDISSLGLHKVRTQMSVIPQYPVLFSGCSVSENLDPFGKHDKLTIRKALEDVQMWECVEELPDGLDSIVAEGGSNFSVGQRQLLCLARAILRKNKILVLDEPTANVDGKTDSLLQSAVAKTFSGSTIISVAHRLDMIISYDMIIVLGNGELLEVGSPSELLSNGNGHFAAMVNDTGEETARRLRNKAFGVVG